MKVITQYLAADNSVQIHEEYVTHASVKQLDAVVKNRVEEILSTFLKVRDENSGEVNFFPPSRILSVTVANDADSE